MMRHVLITGGAGFIGSHLADALLERGYRVRALDSLEEQVHGPTRARPDYLHPDVELVHGNVRDAAAVQRALDGVDAVVHLAAVVGVGQSMYEITRYSDVNCLGTTVLLERLMAHPVERLVVASSMSLYGEGLYRSSDGTIHGAAERRLGALKRGDWEPRDGFGEPLTPLPTPESKPPSLSSAYALSKYFQERIALLIGSAYGIPTVTLRFFNVYGTRQALSNPYTGVLAIFASRLLNRHRPLVHEDGLQRRDFVSVRDVAQACRLALEAPEATGNVFNVGSGDHCTIREIGERLARVLGCGDIQPQITGKYRVGDIRHCFADITLARQVLGYEPCVSLEQGLVELAEWLAGRAAIDRVSEAREALVARGLMV
jgi:dTDP-L-rhamnose 4-epimerase